MGFKIFKEIMGEELFKRKMEEADEVNTRQIIKISPNYFNWLKADWPFELYGLKRIWFVWHQEIGLFELSYKEISKALFHNMYNRPSYHNTNKKRRLIFINPVPVFKRISDLSS